MRDRAVTRRPLDNVIMSDLPGRVVIVGGGLAGFSTCAELRLRGYAGELVLIDSGDLLHDRPPLSKEFLLGTVDEAAIALQSDAWFAEQRIDLRTSTRVVGLSIDAPGVRFEDATTILGDVVVLALGGEARHLPVPGADHPAVYVLRRLDDARRLRGVLRPGARVLVIGAGLIGAEVVSSAVAVGASVTLVDPVQTPLVGSLGDRIAARLHGEHQRRGITVLHAGVERIDDDGGAVRATLSNGLGQVLADVVVVGIGMVPNTGLARGAGLAVDGGILVDDLQRTSVARILAVGDCSRHMRTDGAPLPSAEHWEAAQYGGQVAAAAILGQQPPPERAPWFWSDRHGEHVEVVGSFTAGSSTVVRGDIDAGPFVAFALRSGLVVGAVAVDDPRSARAARRLIERRQPVDPVALADPGADLRRLLRS